MTIELVPYDLDSDEEAEEILKVLKDYYEKSPVEISAAIIKKKKVIYFRAMHDGVQIGISGYMLKTPFLAETVKTTIFKEFQGKGLGKKLSESIETECSRIGIKKVMTTIYHFNVTMLTIKLKQGYTIEGFHPDHEAPGLHEYSLGKILS